MHIWLSALASTAVIVLLPRPEALVAEAQTPDSVTFAITTSVSGREVAFAFVRQSGVEQIAASRIETRGDTVYAWTPARLTILPKLLTAPLRLRARRGEPWLHIVSGASSGFEAWGSEFSVEGAMLRIGPGR
ncbi:MAG TPA: hypothetical protein VJ817_01885 [Gemmatimonadales bacterium]|nr:hypothetical protein [Gemmatimonadales bacterium]